MIWRARTVALAGLVLVWLASCDFTYSFNEYCKHPGRCSSFADGGPPTQISQGTTLFPVTLTGSHLSYASVEVDPPGAGTVSDLSVQDDRISLRLSLPHGAPIGSLVRLRLVWDPQRVDEHRLTDPFVVTPIVVANSGNDATGEGTHVRPYATLARAGQQSGTGDTIHLGPGRYDSIFPDTTTLCDNFAAGLRPGVAVEGEGAGATFIDGQVTRTGTCAFNLSSGDQVVQRLTITGFPEGIRASDRSDGGTGRPRVIDVSIHDGGIGVAARPGSSLLLQRVTVQEAGRGLVLEGADVMFQEGNVLDSYRTGVWMIGTGGTLALDGVRIEHNGLNWGTNFVDGAGLLVASDGGFAFVDGGYFRDNGGTGITIAGSSNTLAVDNSFLRSGFGDGIGLAVQPSSSASVYLASTRFEESNWSVRVEDFLVFNAGKGDAGWAVLGNGRSVRIGSNDLQYRWQSSGTGSGNIWDARPGNSNRPLMTFARTKIDGGWIPPPTTVSSTSTFYGIRVDSSPGASVSFE